MKKIWNITALLLVVGFASVGSVPAQSGTGSPPLMTRRSSDDAFIRVSQLIVEGNYHEAEAIARTNLNQLTSVRGRLQAHITLGTVELFEKKLEDAFLDLTWHWKPSKNATQDLLASITGIQVSNRSVWHDLARTALMDYVMAHHQQIRTEFGSSSYNLASTDPDYIAGTAALLYAAYECDNLALALKFAELADTLAPNRTDVGYVKGILEIRLHEDSAARADLEFVRINASAFLAQKARNALESIKDLPAA